MPTTKKQVRTADIIPVDLNSFLCKNAKILSDLFARFRCSHFFFAIFIFFLVNRMENQAKSAEYERKYESLRDSIHAVLYSDNLWHDFNIVTRYFKLENAYKQHMSEKKYNQAAHRGILSQQPCSSLLRLHPSLPRPWDGGRRNRKT